MAIWLITLKEKVVEKFVLAEGQRVTIGRGQSADIVIDNVSVSRSHAGLQFLDNRYLLTDLGSRNGTLVNGRKIEGTVPVSPSDVIQIGKFLLHTSRDSGEVAPFAMLRTKDGSAHEAGQQADALMNSTVYAALTPVAGGAPRQLRVVKGSVTPPRLALQGKEEFTIGKEDDCDMRVGGGWFSGNITCSVMVSGKNYYLQASPGAGPPAVNGRKISGRERLGIGDLIKVGVAELKFEAGQ